MPNRFASDAVRSRILARNSRLSCLSNFNEGSVKSSVDDFPINKRTMTQQNLTTMHPRILSPLEERQIRAFLKQDGEKNLNMRVLTSRARGNLPQIRSDLELLEKLLTRYDAERKK